MKDGNPCVRKSANGIELQPGKVLFQSLCDKNVFRFNHLRTVISVNITDSEYHIYYVIDLYKFISISSSLLLKYAEYNGF